MLFNSSTCNTVTQTPERRTSKAARTFASFFGPSCNRLRNHTQHALCYFIPQSRVHLAPQHEVCCVTCNTDKLYLRGHLSDGVTRKRLIVHMGSHVARVVEVSRPIEVLPSFAAFVHCVLIVSPMSFGSPPSYAEIPLIPRAENAPGCIADRQPHERRTRPNGLRTRPSGEFVKQTKNGAFSLRLVSQRNARLPTYGLAGAVEGVVTVSKPEVITSVEVKVCS
jgi:hypothetical protein